MGILRQPVMRLPTRSESGTDEQAGFSGGANPSAAYSPSDPSQCAAIVNMRLMRDNEMAKRPGMRLLTTATTNSRIYPVSLGAASPGLVLEINVSGSPATYRFLAFDDTTCAFAVQGSGNLPNSYQSAPTEGVQFRDATGDVLYLAQFTTPTAGLIKFRGIAGTFFDGIGTATGLGRIWVYNQRLFGCKGVPYATTGTSSGRTQTLYWSGLNNGDTIGDTANGGGSAQIRTFGGQNIVGGFALGGSNVILHESAVSIFRGLTFDDISITAGTTGQSPDIGYPRAWQVIDGIGYILTTNGLYLASEGGVQQYSNPEQSDPIRDFIRATSGLSTHDYSYSGNLWYIIDNKRNNEIWFILSISGSGTPTSYGFIYHKRHGRFTGRVTFPNEVGDAWVQQITAPGSARPQPMYYNPASGKIYGWDFADTAFQVFQDGGVNYTSSVQMRRFYTAKPSYQKAFRFLNINMGAGASEAPQATGTSTGASVTYATTAGGTVADSTNMKAQEVNIIQLSGQGSYLDATITDNGTSSAGWSVLRADVDAYILAQRAG